MATSYNQRLMTKLFIEEDKLATEEKRDPRTANVMRRFRLQMKPALDEETIRTLLESTFEKLTGRKISEKTLLHEVCMMVMEAYGYNWDTSCHLVWWCMTEQEKPVTIAELLDSIKKLEMSFKKFEAWALAHIEKFGKLPITTK
jgi:hypothetical protein